MQSDEDPLVAEAQSLNASVFGNSGFRPLQIETIMSVERECRDTILIAGTASGKSLTFQLPSQFAHNMEKRAVTVVVSPLLALQKDQMHECTLRGIGAVCSNSLVDKETSKAIYGELLSPHGPSQSSRWSATKGIQIVYTTPETCTQEFLWRRYWRSYTSRIV